MTRNIALHKIALGCIIKDAGRINKAAELGTLDL